MIPSGYGCVVFYRGTKDQCFPVIERYAREVDREILDSLSFSVDTSGMTFAEFVLWPMLNFWLPYELSLALPEKTIGYRYLAPSVMHYGELLLIGGRVLESSDTLGDERRLWSRETQSVRTYRVQHVGEFLWGEADLRLLDEKPCTQEQYIDLPGDTKLTAGDVIRLLPDALALLNGLDLAGEDEQGGE